MAPFPQDEGGAVLSATIDRYVLGSLVAHDAGHMRVESLDYGVVCDAPAMVPVSVGEAESTMLPVPVTALESVTPP